MNSRRKTRQEVSLRTAGASDIPAIVTLIESASHEPWSVDLVTQVLADPGSWGHLAFLDETRPAGVVLARAAAGEAEILNLVVEPSLRRRGIGAILLAEAVGTARQRKAATLFLEVAVDNVAARHLYDGEGFKTVGRRADYYAHSADIRVDALIMQLDLITSYRLQ